MKTTMTYAKGAYIYFLISFLSTLELAAANTNSYVNIDSTLVTLFKYRKQKKDKITNAQEGMAKRIQPLLKKKYKRSEFKEVLGDVEPTKNDKHLFACLQWAYQEGHQNFINNELEISEKAVGESLVALFGNWRRSPDTTIQDMKEELPQKVSTLIQTKEGITDNNFTEKIGFKAKNLDKPLADVLQWAYHLDDNALSSPEAKNKKPIPNMPKNYQTQIPVYPESNQHSFIPISKEITQEGGSPYPSPYWLLVILAIGGAIGSKIYYKDLSEKLPSYLKSKKRNQRRMEEQDRTQT